jgi:N-acetylneuraminic acid mutarotase
MNDGRVLVAGGLRDEASTTYGEFGPSPTPPLATAEIWDPGTERWAPAPSMKAGRGGAAAVLLPDGRVVIAGGDEPSAPHVPTVEIYDPKANGWSVVGTLPQPVRRPRVVVLGPNRVLLQGEDAAFEVTLDGAR